jgi:hypothetical protein
MGNSLGAKHTGEAVIEIDWRSDLFVINKRYDGWMNNNDWLILRVYWLFILLLKNI